MTKHGDLKKLIRARMSKTGESYTTARRMLLAMRPDANPAEVAVGEQVEDSTQAAMDEMLMILVSQDEDRIAQNVTKARSRVAGGLDPQVSFSYVTPSDNPPFTPLRNRAFWVIQANATDRLYWAWRKARTRAASTNADPEILYQKMPEYMEAWTLLWGFVAAAKGLTHMPGRWARITLPGGEKTTLWDWFRQLSQRASRRRKPCVMYCSHCGSEHWGELAKRPNCPMCGRSDSLSDLNREATE